ncbi:6391_t:CDS:2, partial [Cetraspora pellucida]
IVFLCDNDETPISSFTFVDNNKAVNECLSIDPNNVRKLQQQFNKKDFVQTATELEQVEDKSMIPSLTEKEQLNILYSVLKIVDKRINDDG